MFVARVFRVLGALGVYSDQYEEPASQTCSGHAFSKLYNESRTFCTSHSSVVPTITPLPFSVLGPSKPRSNSNSTTTGPICSTPPLSLSQTKSIAMSRSVPSSRQLSPVRERNVNGNGNKFGNGNKLLNNSSGYISASSNTNGYTSGHASGFASRARTPVAEFVDPAEHPALNPGRVAVITGAASGIGLAAAVQLAGCV